MYITQIPLSGLLQLIVLLAITVLSIFLLRNKKEDIDEEEILSFDGPRKPFFDSVLRGIREFIENDHSFQNFFSQTDAESFVREQILEQRILFLMGKSEKEKRTKLQGIEYDEQFRTFLLDRLIDEGLIIVRNQ